MPTTTKNNQRMYLKPIQASEKFFLPDPSNYFSGGQTTTKDSSKSKSTSKSDDEGNKAMFLHSVRLDQEKQAIESGQRQLESKALDLLTNKYNGDVAEFQRGEYAEYEQGKGFYADMSKIQQQQALYRANKSTAEIELTKWQGLMKKAETDQALNMVIEDEHNNPFRAGRDGQMYQLTQNAKGGLVYRSKDGKTMTKEEGDSLPYVTMSDYMQKTYMDTDYENGMAKGPANYFETYDFKAKPFSTELNDIMAIARLNKSKAGGSNSYLVGKNQIPMDANAANAVADSWVFLKTVSGEKSSNVSAINAAVDTVYSALSEEGRRDLRQQWYKAKKSGQQYASPPDINGESKIQSGEDLPIETFVYNLAAGKVAYQYEEISTGSTSFEMLSDFNKASQESALPEKVTTLSTWLNPLIIDGQGDPTDMSFIDKEEGSDDGYNFKGIKIPILQADPFLTKQLNEELIPTSSTGERSFPPVESLGINQALAPNGQWVDVSGVNAKVTNVTGRSALMPMYVKKDGKHTEEMMYKIEYDANGKPYKAVQTAQHIEIEVEIDDIKEFRRETNYYDQDDAPSSISTMAETYARFQLLGMEGVRQMQSKAAPAGSKDLKKIEGPHSNYIKKNFGMDYTGKIWKEGKMKIWVPVNSVTSATSGTNIKTETEGNANLNFQQLQQKEMDNKISSLATQQ